MLLLFGSWGDLLRLFCDVKMRENGIKFTRRESSFVISWKDFLDTSEWLVGYYFFYIGFFYTVISKLNLNCF